MSNESRASRRHLYPNDADVSYPSIVVDNTPNVVITNPRVRFGLGIGLFVMSLLTAIASLILGTFPEIEVGEAVVSRAIVLSGQIVSLLTAAFGLAVVSPNVPRSLK